MFIKDYIVYRKHKKLIKNIIKSEDLLNNLSKLFGCRFRQDWVGRIYAVINPITQTDMNEKIFEYKDDTRSIESFTNKFIMEKMIIADNFIKNHQLFDILSYEIKQIDNYGNFLLVLTPLALLDLKPSTKRFFISLSIIILATIITLIFI